MGSESSDRRCRYVRVFPSLVMNSILERTTFVFWILSSSVEYLGFVEQLAMKAQRFFVFLVSSLTFCIGRRHLVCEE